VNVLLLYPHSLSAVAGWVHDWLQRDGVVAFFDFASEGKYADQMARLMRRSELIILFVNRAYFETPLGSEEWQLALSSRTPKLIVSFDDAKCPALNDTCTFYRCENPIDAPHIVLKHIKEQQQLSIFVSYARKDADQVARLLKLLNASISQVWIDKSGLKPGDQFPGAILDAIESSKWLMLVWSRNSRDSAWVEKEWSHALSLEKQIIPIRLDSTPLPATLSNTQAFTSLEDESLYDFLRLADAKRPKQRLPWLRSLARRLLFPLRGS
jgi:hypothetical protein